MDWLSAPVTSFPAQYWGKDIPPWICGTPLSGMWAYSGLALLSLLFVPPLLPNNHSILPPWGLPCNVIAVVEPFYTFPGVSIKCWPVARIGGRAAGRNVQANQFSLFTQHTLWQWGLVPLWWCSLGLTALTMHTGTNPDLMYRHRTPVSCSWFTEPYQGLFLGFSPFLWQLNLLWLSSYTDDSSVHTTFSNVSLTCNFTQSNRFTLLACLINCPQFPEPSVNNGVWRAEDMGDTPFHCSRNACYQYRSDLNSSSRRMQCSKLLLEWAQSIILLRKMLPGMTTWQRELAHRLETAWTSWWQLSSWFTVLWGLSGDWVFPLVVALSWSSSRVQFPGKYPSNRSFYLLYCQSDPQHSAYLNDNLQVMVAFWWIRGSQC